MRNLVQYPITYDEAISALQTAQREYYEKYSAMIGSTGGVSLLLVEQFILLHKNDFNEFCRKSTTTVDIDD
jgi:hypothetical protein